MRKPLLLSCFYLLYAVGCTYTPPESSRRQTPTGDSLSGPADPDSIPAPAADKPVVGIPIDYDTTQWTELIRLDSSLQIDMRYAGPENFVGEKMYKCGRCFLRPEAAQAVVSAHRRLRAMNYGLKLFDCYRPHAVQRKLWEKLPDPRYVTDPQKGSMHNRGAAVDLTLTDQAGRTLDMGTPFDYFGKEAYHTYSALPDSILERRRLLKNIMETSGFRSIRTEWWHYSFQEKFYPLSDMLWKCYE